MQLSQKALTDLKKILSSEIGKDNLDQLSEIDLNQLGVFLLTLTAICMKIHIRNKQEES